MGLPTEGFKDLLLAQGYIFGGLSDWAIFIGRQPNDPNACITLYDSGGRANPRWLLDFPSVQIRVRGGANQYAAAANRCLQIKQILLGIPSQDLNGDRWVQVNLTSDRAFVGYDQLNRPEFTMNFNLIIEPAVNALDSRDPL